MSGTSHIYQKNHNASMVCTNSNKTSDICREDAIVLNGCNSREHCQEDISDISSINNIQQKEQEENLSSNSADHCCDNISAKNSVSESDHCHNGVKRLCVRGNSNSKTQLNKSKTCKNSDRNREVLSKEVEVKSDVDFTVVAEVSVNGINDLEALGSTNEEKTSVTEFTKVRRKHRSRAPSTEIYKCPFCNKILRALVNLNRHIQLRHILNTRTHECLQCGKSFNYESKLKAHISVVHGDKKYRCDTCDFVTSNVHYVKLHQESVHQGKKPFSCPQCELSFSRKLNLVRHIKSIHDQEKPFDCPMCNKKFSQISHRDRHYKTIHCDDKPFSCNQCSYGCSKLSDLVKHQRGIHEGMKHFPCSECDKIFTRTEHLKKHVDAVHLCLKPLKCSQCTAKFSQKSDLNRHRRGVHEGARISYRKKKIKIEPVANGAEMAKTNDQVALEIEQIKKELNIDDRDIVEENNVSNLLRSEAESISKSNSMCISASGDGLKIKKEAKESLNEETVSNKQDSQL